ncbi:MAG: hypothetical protein AB1560_01910 [Pseudomonadota bacterium]
MIDRNLISLITETARNRNLYMRCANSMNNRMKAECRHAVADSDMSYAQVVAASKTLIEALPDGEHPKLTPRLIMVLKPLLDTRKQYHDLRADHEKQLRKLARQLPVWPWVETVNGFAELGLALIVAEAGDLNNYPNPAKLWKRFGYAPIKGKACSTWRRTGGLSAEDWVSAGYSPRRRSLMFTIGDSLIKKQNEYREIYLARKAVEQLKAPEASKMLWHRRAQRYMEKRLLRDLWRAWRGLLAAIKKAA